jgi:1-deoxy-D-xylulose 5-phosphate reductoisomerase
MISRVVELTIQASRLQAEPSLDDLLDADRWARAKAEELIRDKDVP